MPNIIHSSTDLLDAIHLTGSGIPNLEVTGSSIPQYFIGSRNSFEFVKDSEYSFRGNILGTKTSTDFEAKMKVFLVGHTLSDVDGNIVYRNAFPSMDPLGVEIAEYVMKDNENRREFRNEEVNFIALQTGRAYLRFVIYSGKWQFANIGIFSYRQFGFNPDEATVLLPLDTMGFRFENLQFKAEVMDANSNIVPLEITADPLYFDGGNIILRGNDNRLAGILTIVPSGSGPVLGGDGRGSYIGIVDTTIQNLPRPVYFTSASSYTGPALVTMYSGSAPFSASSLGPAVGFQVLGWNATSGSSYLDFNSLTGTLNIKGNISFIEGSIVSSSISSGTQGEGTVNYVPLWIGSKTLGNSVISQSTAPNRISVSGSITASNGAFIRNNLLVSGSSTTAFAIGEIASVNRIQTYATGPTIRLLDDGNNYGVVGIRGLSIGGTAAVSSPPANGALIEGDVYITGSVGIGTAAPAYKLEVSGSFAATTKSFVIQHPTKSNYMLEHGVLEGPEHSIFIRGTVRNGAVIKLPEYWYMLVDFNTITVQLTPIGKQTNLYVKQILSDRIVIGIKTWLPWIKTADFSYFVQGTRKDVPSLKVERAR